MKKIIFLPIEIKSRELKPKLYLAYQALKKDYYCFGLQILHTPIEECLVIKQRNKYLLVGILMLKKEIY